MVIYFIKLQTIWKELNNSLLTCSCGEREHVIIFLMGLNDSFSQIRTQILLIDLLSLISQVFSLVYQEEHH